ncbi:MAG: ATP-dependent zinc metalloprotease FtsH, partial [Oscillospiraceae bacterium]|nr:ATP-dependent zinc metalloprotease FtsH [Oscillospiraceae bacterium]
DDAVIKVIAGPEKKSRVVTPKEKKLVSYHEAGHAVATYVCETSHPVKEISIIPRGMAGGYTLSIPEEDSNYRTKKEMKDEIVTLLGGRCAEQLILEDISTGASNDLERTTAIAKAMVMRYGFSDKLGNVVYGHDPQQTFLGRDYGQGQGYSDAVANEIDSEIRSLVDEGYNRCMQILKDNIDKLHIVAKILMEKEKISGDEFAKIMADDYVEEIQTTAAIETVKEPAAEEIENAEIVMEIIEAANEEITETTETVIEPVVSENTAEAEEKTEE